jgi:5-methylcytosine-specific restriction enzyme A
MPTAPLRYCLSPNCPNRVVRGYCVTCQAPRRQVEKRFQRGATIYGGRWRQLRADFLKRPENVLCVRCLEQGRAVIATELDHVRPHRGDPALFYDIRNLTPLCKTHHSEKTAKETWHRG